jgi:hypothetical protein
MLVKLFFMTGHYLGYCFGGLGHGHDTRSVEGAKAPLILLENIKKNWGTDAGLTIPNNGLPSGLLFSFWVWGTDTTLGLLTETNLPASCKG